MEERKNWIKYSLSRAGELLKFTAWGNDLEKISDSWKNSRARPPAVTLKKTIDKLVSEQLIATINLFRYRKKDKLCAITTILTKCKNIQLIQDI